jgi:hypothetical protein
MVPTQVCVAKLRLTYFITNLKGEVMNCIGSFQGVSGGTLLYAKTRYSMAVAPLVDFSRLKPGTVWLWTSQRWAPLRDWGRRKRKGGEIEIELRSGVRFGACPDQRVLTTDGPKKLTELRLGDVLQSSRIPEPVQPKAPDHIGLPAAKLAGRYLAEGDIDGNTIEISGHISESPLFPELDEIARSYGGSASLEIRGNKIYVNIWGQIVHAVVHQLISGEGARGKALAGDCWNYDNRFLTALLEEYLKGDGEWDAKNRRWRLGFTRNYRLAANLRVLAARLGLRLVLHPSFATLNGRRFPSFRGEIRFEPRAYRSCKSPFEILRIRKSRCRSVLSIILEEADRYVTASGIVFLTSRSAS